MLNPLCVVREFFIICSEFEQNEFEYRKGSIIRDTYYHISYIGGDVGIKGKLRPHVSGLIFHIFTSYQSLNFLIFLRYTSYVFAKYNLKTAVNRNLRHQVVKEINDNDYT
jgi:hypothetical protein